MTADALQIHAQGLAIQTLAPALAAVLGAYIIGCLPSAAIVGRRFGFDPRAAGSGNPGATNALRLGGRQAGAAVLAMDLAKGALPTIVAARMGSHALAGAVAAATVVGHTLPVHRPGGGGKGVATAAGAFAVLAPHALLMSAVAFVAVVLKTRIVSAASVVAAAILPLAAIVVSSDRAVVLTSVFLAGVVLVRHRGNISRVVTGSEPRLGDGHRSEEERCRAESPRP